ncbi:MAG: hypothetical protein WCG05_03705 [Alphaproteobacteria bacterium]
MKKLHHSISLIALCLALYGGNAVGSAAAGTEPSPSWWKRCCTKANIEVALDETAVVLIPIGELVIEVLPGIDDSAKTAIVKELEKFKTTIETARKIVGSTMVPRSDGGVNLTTAAGITHIIPPAWQQVILKNIGIFTNESKMALTLLDHYIKGDAAGLKSRIMSQLVYFISAQDDPTTFDTIAYDSRSKILQLVHKDGANIGQGLNIFGAIKDTNIQQNINKVLLDYVDSTKARLATVEKEGAVSLDALILKSTSFIVSEYKSLKESGEKLLIDVKEAPAPTEVPLANTTRSPSRTVTTTALEDIVASGPTGDSTSTM